MIQPPWRSNYYPPYWGGTPVHSEEVRMREAIGGEYRKLLAAGIPHVEAWPAAHAKFGGNIPQPEYMGEPEPPKQEATRSPLPPSDLADDISSTMQEEL